jgi:hypothetical protein
MLRREILVQALKRRSLLPKDRMKLPTSSVQVGSVDRSCKKKPLCKSTKNKQK